MALRNQRRLEVWARHAENYPWEKKGGNHTLTPFRVLLTNLPTVRCTVCGAVKIAGAVCRHCLPVGGE